MYMAVVCRCLRYFNPRTPGGVRPDNADAEHKAKQFQSTHPGWGATRTFPEIVALIHSISIHAPRVGCDMIRLRLIDGKEISIHAPRVGCD